MTHLPEILPSGENNEYLLACGDQEESVGCQFGGGDTIGEGFEYVRFDCTGCGQYLGGWGLCVGWTFGEGYGGAVGRAFVFNCCCGFSFCW